MLYICGVVTDKTKKMENENLKEEEQFAIHDVSVTDDEIYIIDPNDVNYNPYEDRC